MAALARIPFSPRTESVIRQMVGWMTFVAVVHLVLGVLFLGGGGIAGAIFATTALQLGGMAIAIAALLLLIYGGLGLVMALEGVLLFRARTALDAVVSTDTNDQEHLSTAFRRLKLFFLVEVILGALAALGSVLQIAAAILAPALSQMGPLSQVGS